MDLSTDLVRELVRDQFPEFGTQIIEPVASGGTDNAIFRLGDDKSVRLPKREDAVSQVAKEQSWLPRMAPLPLRIPRPLKQGAPSDAYPYPWSIYDWCPGSPLVQTPPDEWQETANALVTFLLALQTKTVIDAPEAGPQNHFRGVDLAQRDVLTRGAIKGIAHLYSAKEMEQVWLAAFEVKTFAGPPVWLHGDLQGGNLLAVNGKLSAVIDFGLSGVGDPACDLIVAWSVLPRSVRMSFREQMACDDDMWMRGRGWALSVAVIALDYYRERNPQLSAISRQTIEAVLGEV